MIEMRMDGRSALITGGSKGIGYAAAVNFIKAGGNVAIVARRPSVLEEARAAIQREGSGVAVLLNCGEDADKVKNFLTTQNLELPVALDADQNVQTLYGATSIPRMILIGKDGTVQAVHAGFSPELGKDLREQLDTLFEAVERTCPILNLLKHPQSIRATLQHTRTGTAQTQASDAVPA